ncbi:MAG: TMEM14 family protein [Armatimonadetes bacterium]|nr:TMEM14 family protein [Armatimonadota bacterium]
MTFAKWAMVVYGVAMIGMGVHGFVGSGSPMSLAGGGGAGALVLFFAWLSVKMSTPRVGYILATLVCLGMLGMFIPKYSDSREIYPHLTIVVLSALTAVCLVGGHLMARMAKKKAA